MGARRLVARAPAALRLAPHALLAAFCAGLLAALAGRRPARGGGGRHRARRRRGGGVGRPRQGRAGAGAPGARGGAGRLGVGQRAAGGDRRRPAWTCRRTRRARSSSTPRRSPTATAGCGRGPWSSGWPWRRGRRCPGGRACCSTSTTAAGRPALGERLRVSGRLRPAARAGRPRVVAPLAGAPGDRGAAAAGVAARRRPPRRAAGRCATAGGGGRRRDAGAGLSGDRRELVRGMALGGGSGLSEGAAEAFRDAGLWHLLAVSAART